MSELPAVLICLRVPAEHTAESFIKLCNKCSHEIWVSPSALDHAGPNAELLCVVCWEPCDDDEIVPPSAGQLRELRNHEDTSRN